MARESGLYRRRDSRFWWVDIVLPNGRRLCGSTKAESKREAQAYVAKLKREAYEQGPLGVSPPRTWQEAVVRYLSVKSNLRSIEDVKRICRKLDPYFGELTLEQITGDRIWAVVEGERKK